LLRCDDHTVKIALQLAGKSPGRATLDKVEETIHVAALTLAVQSSSTSFLTSVFTPRLAAS